MACRYSCCIELLFALGTEAIFESQQLVREPCHSQGRQYWNGTQAAAIFQTSTICESVALSFYPYRANIFNGCLELVTVIVASVIGNGWPTQDDLNLVVVFPDELNYLIHRQVDNIERCCDGHAQRVLREYFGEFLFLILE